jgi:hypothetical protein
MITAINPDSIIINEIMRAKYLNVKTDSNFERNDFLGVLFDMV